MVHVCGATPPINHAPHASNPWKQRQAMADELELIELEELQNKSLNSGDGSKSTLWFPVFPEAIGGKVQKCLRFKPVGHFRYLQMPGVLAMARKTTIPREKKNAGWKTSC